MGGGNQVLCIKILKMQLCTSFYSSKKDNYLIKITRLHAKYFFSSKGFDNATTTLNCIKFFLMYIPIYNKREHNTFHSTTDNKKKYTHIPYTVSKSLKIT